MKKQLIALALLLASLTAGAQDKILDKYSAMGDVTTTSVTRSMLDRLTAEQRELLSEQFLTEAGDKIQSIKLLSSDKPKAAKQLKDKLPSQLLSNGFVELGTTKQGSATVRMLHMKNNPNSIVLVVTNGNKVTVASIKGNFAEQ